MTHRHNSAEDTAVVTRNCVIETIRPLLRNAIVVKRRFTAEQLADLSGVKVRAIRSYMGMDDGEVREPSLSSALSLATVLGTDAVNSILGLMGYGGAKPLEEAGEAHPMQDMVTAMGALNVFVQAAADDRIDHLERPQVEEAANTLVATFLPYSQHGGAA